MKEKRLLNELGNVNDDFIEQAKPKIKNNRKKLYAVIGLGDGYGGSVRSSIRNRKRFTQKCR